MIIDQAQHHKEEMIGLLASEKLPVADLPEMLENFLVAIQDARVVGVIGLEIYGDYGLLRSLAVGQEQRGRGIAGKLIRRLENQSKTKNLKALYLLTETAAEYFACKGFQVITRPEVPVLVQGSSEFSHVCPVSAVVMKKNLNK